MNSKEFMTQIIDSFLANIPDPQSTKAIEAGTKL